MPKIAQPKRLGRENRLTQTCPCGVEFVPRRNNQKFHSVKCRKKAWKDQHEEVFTSKNGKVVVIIRTK